MPLAAFGLVSPVIAMGTMATSRLLVGGNSRLCLRNYVRREVDISEPSPIIASDTKRACEQLRNSWQIEDCLPIDEVSTIVPAGGPPLIERDLSRLIDSPRLSDSPQCLAFLAACCARRSVAVARLSQRPASMERGE